jgi:hypothetical protein
MVYSILTCTMFVLADWHMSVELVILPACRPIDKNRMSCLVMRAAFEDERPF